MLIETLLLSLFLVGDPVAPAEGSEEWLELDREIMSLAPRAASNGNGPHFTGFLTTTYALSDGEIFTGGGKDISGVDIRHVRPITTGDIGKWWYEVSMEGGDGSFELLDAYGVRKVSRHAYLTVGQFKQPLLHSTFLRRQNLLFFDRTVNGEETDDRDIGVMLEAAVGPFDLYGSIQNGVDGKADNLLFTGRVAYDVIGDVFRTHEGARNQAEGMNLGVAFAGASDDGIENGTYGAAEAQLSVGSLYFHGDIITHDEEFDVDGGLAQGADNNEFLNTNKGNSSPFSLTLSYLFGDEAQYELGLRLDRFDDADETGRISVVLNVYGRKRGHLSKWQIVLQDVNSDNDALEGSVWELGYVFGWAPPPLRPGLRDR